MWEQRSSRAIRNDRLTASRRNQAGEKCPDISSIWSM
jgi:hypothetical protein